MIPRAVLAAGLLAAGLALPVHADCTRPDGLRAAATEFGREMNAVRDASGRPLVRLSPRLAAIAQDHACGMVRGGYFAHTAPDGTGLRARVERAGYDACAAAENIARGYDLPDLLRAWMDSDGHRRNILDGKVTEFGIGVAYDGARPYWVLVLGRRCGTMAGTGA